MENNTTKHFNIFQKMIDDNNQGISVSTTVTDSNSCKQGGIVQFGVECKFSDDARAQLLLGVGGKYMMLALFVDREEFEKYKANEGK